MIAGGPELSATRRVAARDLLSARASSSGGRPQPQPVAVGLELHDEVAAGQGHDPASPGPSARSLVRPTGLAGSPRGPCGVADGSGSNVHSAGASPTDATALAVATPVAGSPLARFSTLTSTRSASGS